MFDRSNQQKDAVTAYHGLTAVLEACGGEEAVEALRKNIAGNLEFPLHREVARLLDDSNMLVFPNSESFASWIRAQATRNGGQFFLDAGTPAILRLKTSYGTASGFSTTRRQRRTPIWGMTDGDAMTISHLANRISPREKCRDRGAGHSRRRRYAIVPGAPSVPLRFSHAKWRVFACKRSDHGENLSPCRAPASAVRDSPRLRQRRRADSSNGGGGKLCCWRRPPALPETVIGSSSTSTAPRRDSRKNIGAGRATMERVFRKRTMMEKNTAGK